MNMIRVWPANEDIRRAVKHPSGGGFTNKEAGTAWPADQFTYRRINDGDVLTTDPVVRPQPDPEPKAPGRAAPRPSPKND